MSITIQYRNAQRDDLVEVANIFIAAFPDSIKHYVGGSIAPAVLVDAFAICLDAEPEAFIVAVTENRVIGYIIAPSCFSRLIGVAIWHGHLMHLAWRWLMGQYGIGFHPVRIAARNWLALAHEAREERLHSEARILSIAVDPQVQGHGVGTELLHHGLAYLEKQQVTRVRLEVRPENTPAIHLYEKFGFVTKGTTRDTQGKWLIMLKFDMAAHR